MSDTIKGVMREFHVKTKDDFGKPNWDSVYKIGTGAEYVKINNGKYSLADILGYNNLTDDEIHQLRTIKQAIDSGNTITDYYNDYWAYGKKSLEGNRPARMPGHYIPSLWKGNQFFYSGNMEYYATGSIMGTSGFLSMNCITDYSVEDIIEELLANKKNEIRGYKGSVTAQSIVFPEDPSKKKTVYFDFYYGAIGKITDAPSGNSEVTIDSVHIADKNTRKIVDTGPASDLYLGETRRNFSLYPSMPVHFVVPKNTFIYTRAMDSTSAGYCINFLPKHDIEEYAHQMFNEFYSTSTVQDFDPELYENPTALEQGMWNYTKNEATKEGWSLSSNNKNY